MTETHQASTGIEGLDDILRGGLPRDRIYLLKGEPGAGKTTLAFQFLLAGVAVGETCLYISLSETRGELEGVAQSHGWTLDGLSLFELPHEPLPVGQYSMFHPSEVELGRAMGQILERIQQVKPSRVVVDSLAEIRLLAQQSLRYRRQILDLKYHLAGVSSTVLLLDDRSDESVGHVETLAHGVILLERQSPVYGGTRRRMEISKLRGVDYRAGYHDCIIEHGGLRVYPRLIAAEHLPTIERGRLRTGVAALDALLGGGLDHGTATLLLGPAGTGKSAIGTQCAISAAENGETAAIFTFDESIAMLLARSDSVGMSLREHVDAGRIRIQQVDPAEMSPGQFAHAIRQAVERDNVRVVVIDSLTGYLNSMPEERYLLNQLHELLSFLGQAGVVSLLVATQHGFIGATPESPVDVSYLTDTLILLRYFETAGAVRKAISVVKNRGGSHERTLREFELGSDGIRIGPPLQAFHGVLSGLPQVRDV